MPAGTVKVYLVGATAIRDSEWIGKGDPYAVIECGNQHVKSNTATDQGSKPTWNQKFHFLIDDGVTDIIVKIYNENNLQVDDLIGSAKIPLADIFAKKKLPIQTYSIEPRGDINLQIAYTPEVKAKIQKTHCIPGPYDPAIYSSPYLRS
ncbi:hypothetical protein R1flu_013885 [Riccia fluitans]|uniref:C2 domain-containing protein n=1 Tax=Riccia fluitans TaxID=41844 RepID=A0ABD1YI02_9MARC